MPPDHADLLDDLRNGRREGLDRITVLVYDELREIAHRHRATRKASETLATTALVHEAYLELVDQSCARWNDRAHFLAIAGIAMRQILADSRTLQSRGEARRSTCADHTRRGIDRVVEYRFFGGMTHEEIGESLGVTVRTVERDRAKARMLLRDDLRS